MAYNKPSPNSLIHCSKCGEDYSVTYKRCPFCGARNLPQQPDPDPDRPDSSSDLEDTYVFDGQELFDGEGEEDYSPSRSRGGKRLAGKPMPNPFANADINWPRVITFVCSLIIIVSAMVIVFTVVYPQLRGDPTADSTESLPPTDGLTQSAAPSAGVSGAPATGPEPTAGASPAGSGELRSFTTNIYGNDTDGFTLAAGGSWQMQLTFTPANWSGEVTYSVSDTRYATVSAGGNVVNVNQESGTRRVMLTITAGGITLEMPVYCTGVTAASDPPVTSDPPAAQTPSGGGTGQQGTVANVGTAGLNVRSGPGTNFNIVGSLRNGNSVTILEQAADGWYKISFAGTGGAATEGYVLGTYITLN